MLALKKKQQAAAEAAAAEAATSAAADAASGAGGGAGDGEGKKISLLGGDDARKSTGGPAKKKLKPGEIRIQKGKLLLIVTVCTQESACEQISVTRV